MLSLVSYSIIFLATGLSVYGLMKRSWLCFAGLYLLGSLGQLGRIFVSKGSIGYLSMDMLIPLLVFSWGIFSILRRKNLPTSFLGSSLLIFLGVMVWSFLLVIPTLPLGEVSSSLSYLIRYISYVGLFFMAKDFFQEEKNQRALFPLLFTAGSLLILGGIIQFIFVPDFRFMAHLGWDPHIGRLLGTWYDPNYIGGFFAFISAFVLGHLFFRKEKTIPFLHTTLLFALFACVLLTYSRSALLAQLIVLFVFGILRARVFVLIILLLGSVAVASNERLQERTLGLWEGAMATITGSDEYMLDITSQKRVESWNEAATIIDGHWLFGIGYNTITYRKLDKGLIPDTTKHSASGTDASLLNVFLTTGTIGLLAYLYFLVLFLVMCWNLYKKHPRVLVQGYGLGAFSGTLGILGHAVFVNTLFLPLFLVYLFPLLALLDTWYMQISSIQASGKESNKQSKHYIPRSKLKHK